MQIVGKTNDGKEVVAGLATFYFSHGIPLEILFDKCAEEDLVISWLDFFKECIESGWSKKTFVARVMDPICDVFGLSAWKAIESRLQL